MSMERRHTECLYKLENNILEETRLPATFALLKHFSLTFHHSLVNGTVQKVLSNKLRELDSLLKSLLMSFKHQISRLSLINTIISIPLLLMLKNQILNHQILLWLNSTNMELTLEESMMNQLAYHSTKLLLLLTLMKSSKSLLNSREKKHQNHSSLNNSMRTKTIVESPNP